jgi:hypothetical protein
MTSPPHNADARGLARGGRGRRTHGRGLALVVALVAALSGAATATATATAAPLATTVAANPDFDSNVVIFDPGMPVSQIRATADAIYARQVDNEMGTERYALLFKPGYTARTPIRSRSRSATTPRSPASARRRRTW